MTPPTMIADYLFPPASRALNQALMYAPAAQAQLQQVGPQVWRLHLTDLELDLDLVSTGQELTLHTPDDAVPDADISGASKDMLTLLRSADKTSALASLPIRIEGSTRSFMQLQTLATHLDLDWEAWLGDLVGDLPAHHLANLGRFAGGEVKASLAGLQSATERYVIREKRWLVTRPEAEELMQETQALRRRTDKLMAQIKRLQASSAKPSPPFPTQED